jgi:endonuclease-3
MFDQLPLPLEADARLTTLHNILLLRFGTQRDSVRFDPKSQLINAMLSSETRDEISKHVFHKLRDAHYPFWGGLAACYPRELAWIIRDVAHADVKARQIVESVRIIQQSRGHFELSFLADWPVDAAMTWLQQLPGVGPKISAATLNFSDLRRRVLVVDRHVLRITQRVGFVPYNAEAGKALRFLMRMAPTDWTADSLYELHWLIKMQSQDTCHLNGPDCTRCPLLRICAFGQLSEKQFKPTSPRKRVLSAPESQPLLV